MTAATNARLVELRRGLHAAHVKAQVIQDGAGDEAIAELMERATDQIGNALEATEAAAALAQDHLATKGVA